MANFEYVGNHSFSKTREIKIAKVWQIEGQSQPSKASVKQRSSM